MFAVTLLGTSASVPSADRNQPGLLVEAGGDRVWWIAAKAPSVNCSEAGPGSGDWIGCC